MCMSLHISVTACLFYRGNGDFLGHLESKGKQGSAFRDPRWILLPYCFGKWSHENIIFHLCLTLFMHSSHCLALCRVMLVSRGNQGLRVLQDLASLDHQWVRNHTLHTKATGGVSFLKTVGLWQTVLCTEINQKAGFWFSADSSQFVCWSNCLSMPNSMCWLKTLIMTL